MSEFTFIPRLTFLRTIRPVWLMVLGLLSGFLVWWQAGQGESGFIFTGSVVVFGGVLGLLIDRWTSRYEKTDLLPEYFLLTLVFSFLWGRIYFVGYFAHDEFGYFSLVGQNLAQSLDWLIRPINEHFQPVFKLALTLIFLVFSSDYFGLALFSFVFTLLCLQMFLRLLAVCGQRRVTRSFVGLFFCLTLALAETHRWKAAGSPLYFTTAPFLLFFVLFVQSVQSKSPPGRNLWLVMSALSIAVIYSSSLLSVMPVYLVPAVFLVWKTPWKRRWLAVVSLPVFLAFLLYFGIRSQLVETQINMRSIDPLIYLGAYFNVGILKFPGGWNRWVGLLLLMLFVVTAIRAWKRGDERTLFVLFFGGALFAVGAAQLTLGRGVLIPVMYSRYLFLPMLGILFVISPMINALYERVVSVGVGLLLLVLWSHWMRLETLYPREKDRAVIQARAQFNAKLEEILCDSYHSTPYGGGGGPHIASLPDPGMTSEYFEKELIIAPPFSMKEYGGTLKYFAKALGSRCFHSTALRFVEPERFSETEFQGLPEKTKEFYQTYFPNMERL